MACSKSCSASVEKKPRGHSGARERFERRVVKDQGGWKENRVTRMTQILQLVSPSPISSVVGKDSIRRVSNYTPRLANLKKGRIKRYYDISLSLKLKGTLGYFCDNDV